MSNPFFEASVRLQLDVGNFEQQAQQSIKTILDKVEQQTQQSIRSSQQRVAQAAQQLQQQAQQAAAPPPQQVQQRVQEVATPPPVPVQLELFPPTPQNVVSVQQQTNAALAQTPAKIPTQVLAPDLANIETEISAASDQLDALAQSGETARRELASVQEELTALGARRPGFDRDASSETAAEVAALETRAAALQEQITKENQLAEATRQRLKETAQAAQDFRPPAVDPNPQLLQAVEQAKALASQPIDFTIKSNTDEFERETAAAFARAGQLARANADAAGQEFERATAAATDAVSDALAATGDERIVAVAEAQLQAAVARQAEVAKQAADDFLTQVEQGAADAAARPATELRDLSELAATQAQTAELLGDEAGRAAKELESLMLAQLFAAESAESQASVLLSQAGEATGIARQQMEAEAQNLLLAADKAREAFDTLRREGPQLRQPPGGGPDDPNRGSFSDAFTSIARGRSGGIGGLIGGAARFGIAGFAATAAFQAFSEIQGLLRATGDEAFTTQGKLRNLGAELISGNIIGGIKALTAAKPATLTGGLNEFIEQQKAALDETNISLEEVVRLQQDSGEVLNVTGTRFEDLAGRVDGASDALSNFLLEQVDAGAISLDFAEDIATAAISLAKLQEQSGAAAEALREVEVAIARAGSEAAKFGREGGLEGRGTGQIGSLGAQAGQGEPGQVTGRQRTGIQRDIVTNPFENQTFQAPDPAVGAAVRASLAERQRSEEARLAAELRNARITREQAQASFDAAKEANKTGENAAAAREAYLKLVQATTGVANAAQAVKDQAERAAVEMQAAEDRIASAQVSAIRDPEAQAQAQLALDQATQAREGRELEQARAAFKKKTITAVELKQAEAEYAEAVAATTITQNQIADAQDAAAEAARDSRLSAEQQSLENEIAKAALTARLSDDREAFAAAIAYWKNLANEAGTAEEREQAQAKVIALREQRRQTLQGDASGLRQQQLQNQLAAAQLADNIPQQRLAAEAIVRYWEGQEKALSGTQKAQATAARIAAEGTLKGIEQSAIGVDEQRIQNRIQAARLTKGLADDKRAADALVAFWEQQVKDATGADKVRKRANLIAARLARQGLEEQASAAGGGPTTVDFLKISQGIIRDFASNLLPTGSTEAAKAQAAAFGQDVRTRSTAGLDTSDVFGRAVKIEEESRDELRRIREILERDGGVGPTVNVTQNMRTPDPSGFAQAKYARFAMEEAFNG